FVEIKLENTVFRIGLLDAEREDHFSQLALDGLISCQEEVLGDLLGNRRGANKAASSAKILEISDNRTGKTRHVDAWMTIKVFVLSREKRRFYAIRDRLNRQIKTPLAGEFRHQLTVRRMDARGDRWLVASEDLIVGQIG